MKKYSRTEKYEKNWVSENWMGPNPLWLLEEAGVAELVFPIHAEAHALPYAEGFFDAAISIDSYQYYGADEMYFPCTYSKLVRSGGQFGIVVPGLTKEFDKGYPDTLKELWGQELQE